MPLKYKVASVQASPIFFDAAATVVKTLALLCEAAAGGASLVVFPELWLPGYPFYLWLYPYPATTKFSANYYANSLTSDGPEAKQLQALCKELAITAVIGVSERDHGSLYMAQWIIGPDGEFIARRRKLKPTLVERMCFGEGDGSDIRVYDTSLGRLGALMCWEHVQPLVKYAMATQHEQIHCASWPHFDPEMPFYSLSMEANFCANTMYSVETGAYNIASSAPLSQQNQDVLVDGNDDLRKFMPLGGGLTQIFGPGRTTHR